MMQLDWLVKQWNNFSKDQQKLLGEQISVLRQHLIVTSQDIIEPLKGTISEFLQGADQWPDEFEGQIDLIVQNRESAESSLRVWRYFDVLSGEGWASHTHICNEGSVRSVLREAIRSWMGAAELKELFGDKTFDFPKAKKLVEDAIRACGAAEPESITLDFFAGSGTTGEAVIRLARETKMNYRYILIEQGEYFETVLKPRIQKVVFSAEWANGKPTAPETGISHCFKVLQLESYEDTLNNLQLRRPIGQPELFTTLPQQAKDDYLLHYMLNVESRSSLLSVEDFKKPFDCRMNIAVDSAGAYEPRKIDLVETFNYLVGLRVDRIDAQPSRGFVTVTGTLPDGESCLVLWRDCDILGYEGTGQLADAMGINPVDNKFDVVYINGDHNIPTVLTQTAEEGDATRVLKLRQIEPEFLSRMFSVEDI